MELDLEKQKKQFLDICRTTIHRDGLEDLLDWLCKADFFSAPASTKYHGAYAGGLCQHALDVYDYAKKLAFLSPAPIKEESLCIASLFHDVCKVHYYKTGTRNVKDESGKWITKEVYEVDEQFPIGHGEKSCIILQWFLKKLTVDELLAIRFHMGGFDAAVKGGDTSASRAYNQCPLAVMLHLADLEASYLIETKNQA